MKLLWAISLLAVVAFCASTCLAVPTYRIETLGLTDSEHTRGDGYKESFASYVDEQGRVVGYSERFNLGPSSLGRTVWVYDGSTVRDIGLDEPEHYRADGYKGTQLQEANSAGYVIGISDRYDSSTQNGRSLWLYDGLTTQDIGLRDTEHTRSDGLRFSNFNDFWAGHMLNNSGHAIGSSNRFDGSQFRGETAWLYDGLATLPIGLTQGNFTRQDGYRNSLPVEINDAGQIVGSSDRYFSGGEPDGRTAWLLQNGTYSEIGLHDSEHLRGTGQSFSTPFRLNQAGFVLGSSQRYQGNEYAGDSVWLFDGENVKNVGLADAEHTSSDGYKSSYAEYLNEGGQVIGQSNRYMEGNYRGESAWLYDGHTTVEISLPGSEHTRDNGFRSSSPLNLNNAGQVAGVSARYNGTVESGQSAWIFDGASTIDISLTDSEHTSIDGYRNSFPRVLNNSGQVAGHSLRYRGLDYVGQDAWLYDFELQQRIIFQPAVRDDDYAYSSITYLGDDGLLLGTYQLYNDANDYLGQRVFSYTAAGGIQDLNVFVDIMSADDWEYFASAFRTAGNDYIVGAGKLTSGSMIAYLLTPITADFNNDGRVDGRDFLAWQRGESPRPLSAEDLALWQQQYGGGNSLDAVSAVPEPHTLALVLCSLLLAARVR